jgi:hypothetical protein
MVLLSHSLRLHRRLPAPTWARAAPLSALALSPDGRCLVAGLADGRLLLLALHWGAPLPAPDEEALEERRVRERVQRQLAGQVPLLLLEYPFTYLPF